MISILEGFALISVIIAVGWLLAHLRVLTADDQAVLARVTFTAGAPALLFLLVSRADLGIVLNTQLLATLAGVVAAALAYVLIARFWLRRPVAHLVIGSMAASYVNANNLGLPIAVYVLGDGTLVTSMLLLQLLFLQPSWLAVLDVAQARRDGRRVGLGRIVSSPVRNPLTVASLAGLIVNATNVELPSMVLNPLEVIGGLAIPAMLIAFGVSLRFGPAPGAQGTRIELALITGIKLMLMPAVTWLTAAYLLDLDTTTTLAATVIAALPSAQNVFGLAVVYRQNVDLARDAAVITTLLSLPAIVLIAALLS